jgi:SAM-dependent methyltransferase
MSESHLQYFEYLQEKSRLGTAYRNHLLYPRLGKFLTGKVLDIGCGVGDFLSFRKNTVGIDVNENTVNYCKNRGLEVYLAPSIPYPFAGHSFEGAVADNVIEHLTNAVPLIREAHRVLSPGGTFIVGVPGRKGFSHDPDHKKFYDEKDLREVVCSNGFELRALLRMPMNLFLLDRILPQYAIYGVFSRSKSDLL